MSSLKQIRDLRASIKVLKANNQHSLISSLELSIHTAKEAYKRSVGHTKEWIASLRIDIQQMEAKLQVLEQNNEMEAAQDMKEDIKLVKEMLSTAIFMYNDDKQYECEEDENEEEVA